jgi:hypothetical protein
MKKVLILLVTFTFSIGFLGAHEVEYEDSYFLNLPGYHSVIVEESIYNDFDSDNDGIVDGENFSVRDFVSFYNMLTMLEEGYLLKAPGSSTILNKEKIRTDFDRAGLNLTVDEFIDFYDKLLVKQRIDFHFAATNELMRLVEEPDFTYTYEIYGSSCPFLSLPRPQNSELGYGPRR